MAVVEGDEDVVVGGLDEGRDDEVDADDDEGCGQVDGVEHVAAVELGALADLGRADGDEDEAGNHLKYREREKFEGL